MCRGEGSIKVFTDGTFVSCCITAAMGWQLSKGEKAFSRPWSLMAQPSGEAWADDAAYSTPPPSV